MILCRIILFASISMPFFPLHGEVASVGNGIHTKDEEALRLISVIDNQKVDFYKDGTRIILAERLSQLNLKDDLRSFVGKDPASGRFTVSWFKENLLFVDFLLRTKSSDDRKEAEGIVRRLLTLQVDDFLKGELSGDRLKALQSPGPYDSHFSQPKEVAEERVKYNILRATDQITSGFNQQRKAAANRLAVIVFQDQGSDGLTKLVEEFKATDIRDIFLGYLAKGVQGEH